MLTHELITSVLKMERVILISTLLWFLVSLSGCGYIPESPLNVNSQGKTIINLDFHIATNSKEEKLTYWSYYFNAFDAVVDTVNAIWNILPITFKINKISNAIFDDEHFPNFWIDSFWGSNNLDKIIKANNSYNDINIYFMGQIRDAEFRSVYGRSISNSGKTTAIFISEGIGEKSNKFNIIKNVADVLAHEIGHMFQLEHTGDSTNVMYSNPDDYMADFLRPLPLFLTIDQISVVKAYLDI